LETGFH